MAGLGFYAQEDRDDHGEVVGILTSRTRLNSSVKNWRPGGALEGAELRSSAFEQFGRSGRFYFTSTNKSFLTSKVQKGFQWKYVVSMLYFFHLKCFEELIAQPRHCRDVNPSGQGALRPRSGKGRPTGMTLEATPLEIDFISGPRIGERLLLTDRCQRLTN